MATESPGIAELCRRVQSDPSSMVFAQLAEEYRRTGSFTEAVDTCRAGLEWHPACVPARVTLGRALLELGDVDGAEREFEGAIGSAPDSLAAVRGLAEVHRRRGHVQGALTHYRRALELAHGDAVLEATIEQIRRDLDAAEKRVGGSVPFANALDEFVSTRVSTPDAAGGAARANVRAPAAGDLFDFDRVLTLLGVQEAAVPPLVEACLDGAAPPAPRPKEIPAQEIADEGERADDMFLRIEQDLRRFEAELALRRTFGPPESPLTLELGSVDQAVLDELERWLDVLDDRRGEASFTR